MFNELYKKSMDDIKPDELLVKKTKNAMNKELKNKPKTFYKYAATAACLIITFSLFRFSFNIKNNATMSSINNDTNNSVSDSLDLPKPNNSISTPVTLPNANNFIQAGNKGTPFSADTSDNMSHSLSSAKKINIPIISNLLDWIGGIIEWFKELFY